MDFDTFKTNTLQYLWRVGDTDLEAAMPRIVATAENRIRTDLKLHSDDVIFHGTVTENPYQLPPDMDEVIAINWPGQGAGVYITPHRFSDWSAQLELWPGSTPDPQGVGQLEYTVVGDYLRHRWNADTTHPVDIEIVYTPKPASLVDDDDTLFQLYTEMFEKAVYREAEIFLRNEARAQFFDGLYAIALDSVRFDQARRRRPGSPLKMSMPRRDIC